MSIATCIYVLDFSPVASASFAAVTRYFSVVCVYVCVGGGGGGVLGLKWSYGLVLL